MSTTSATPYDEIAYPSAALPQAHPDRLATIATLFGMKPAPVTRCRVLELGCGNGANLIPMAFELRESQFVGIDLAARPVAEGQALGGALGLSNLRLVQGNLLDITPEWGQFDYIIAHGLYAWVPRPVQDKLLAICRQNLAPAGVAYVSYNTYPGSHLRDLLRQMMLFHIQGISEPAQQIAEAKALARFLAIRRGQPDAFLNFMQAEADQILEHADGHLYHDELAECYAPVYFHQFMAHARQHQLRYLGEADFYEMQDQIYPEAVLQELNRVADTRLRREQYLDFLKCRRFRQTLLCHYEVSLAESVEASCLRLMHCSSQAQPATLPPNLAPGQCQRFVGRRGAALETDHALTKAALCILGETWPHRLSFDQIVAQAKERLRGGLPLSEDQQESETFGTILLQAYATGMVELHLHNPQHVVEPGARPAASALVRLEIERGPIVTNLYHHSVKVEGGLAKTLLQLLDGTRSRAELVEAMAASWAARTGACHGGGERPEGAAPSREALAQQLDTHLAKLAKLGLLVP